MNTICKERKKEKTTKVKQKLQTKQTSYNKSFTKTNIAIPPPTPTPQNKINMSSYSFSKLGGKYNRSEVEQLDKIHHAELKQMFRQLNCSCGSRHCNWATLKRGSERFVCINCAQKLRADAQNKIKSCMGTYLWHLDEMEAIRSGFKAQVKLNC